MPTLANINGRSLTADVGGRLQQGLAFGENLATSQYNRQIKSDEMERQKQIELLRGQMIPGTPGFNPNADLEMLKLDPDAYTKTMDAMQIPEGRERERVARRAEDILSAPEGMRNQVIMRQIAEIEARGDDASHSRELLTMSPEEQTAWLEISSGQGRGAQSRYESRTGQPEFSLSDLTPEQQEDARLSHYGILPDGGGAGSTVSPVDAAPLVEGLPESVQKKGVAAFQAAGGGKDGVKALQAAVEVAKGEVSLEEIPQTLAQSFPNASEAEMKQLEAAAMSGKTAEAGLKAAASVREEQRRLKKAQGFQSRAVELLDRILSSDQIGDVTGSLEGSYDMRLFSDAEAGLIADIEEAQNILTADNLDLMTGVLSESDIKIIKSLAGGGLNRKRGEKRFIGDATKLRDKLASKLVETADDQPSRVVYDPVTGELAPK